MIVRIFIFLLLFVYAMPIAIPALVIWILTRRHLRKKREANYNERLNRTIAEYGIPSKAIRYDYDYMLIYENRKELYIQGQIIQWNNIVDFRIPHEHNVYETDNSNMFKRSFWGWLIFGDLGGVVSGTTGRKVSAAYKKNKGRFHLLIQTDNIRCANIHLFVTDSDTLEDIISCLNLIKQNREL